MDDVRLASSNAEVERLIIDAERETLAARHCACRQCELSLQRTHLIPGGGSPRAHLMFIGEHPGPPQDAVSDLFHQQLAAVGLRRADVFIAHIIRCRPPQSDDPPPEEMDACRPWLHEQVRVIRPQIVCTLGRFALHALIDPTLQMSAAHGIPLEDHGIRYVPLFHPAAAQRHPLLLDAFLHDLAYVRDLLSERVE